MAVSAWFEIHIHPELIVVQTFCVLHSCYFFLNEKIRHVKDLWHTVLIMSLVHAHKANSTWSLAGLFIKSILTACDNPKPIVGVLFDLDGIVEVLVVLELFICTSIILKCACIRVAIEWNSELNRYFKKPKVKKIKFE